jgi:nucleoside-diphosphate-sugar epimerase
MSTLNDYYVPDIKSIKKELGLEITVSLNESIKRLVEYYKE